MMSRFTGVIRILEKSGNYYFLDKPVIRMILLICKNIETGENAVTRKTTSLLYIVEYNYTSAVYTRGDPEIYFKYKCIYKSNKIEIIKF